MKAQWSWVWDNECNWLACHCAGWWWCNSYLPNTDWAAHCTGLPPHILPGAGLVLRTLSLTSSLSALAVESKYLIFVNIITSSRRQYRRERERDEYNVEERREKNIQPGCSLLSFCLAGRFSRVSGPADCAGDQFVIQTAQTDLIQIFTFHF